MKKITYTILTAGQELLTVNGYYLTYCGLNFGLSNKRPDGKKDSHWTVTELSTGMSLGYYAMGYTLKSAAQAVYNMPDHLIESINNIIADRLKNTPALNTHLQEVQ